jgi:hypothetical protein
MSVENIKVEHLRKKGFQSLEKWLENPNHVYIGREMSFYVVGAKKSKWTNRSPCTKRKFGRMRR